MDNAIYEIRKGAILHKSLPPMDVQIVACYLYFFGFLELAVGLLWSITPAGSADHASRHVLLGTVVLATGSAEGIYMSCMSAGTLFCAWGLIRCIKFAWWFTVIFHIYGWVDTALSFPQSFSRSPVSIVGSMVLGLLLFTWLWLRRELYGVHLATSHTKASEIAGTRTAHITPESFMDARQPLSVRPRPKAARRNLAADGRCAIFEARFLDYAALRSE